LVCARPPPFHEWAVAGLPKKAGAILHVDTLLKQEELGCLRGVERERPAGCSENALLYHVQLHVEYLFQLLGPERLEGDDLVQTDFVGQVRCSPRTNRQAYWSSADVRELPAVTGLKRLRLLWAH
jgi:hypothetical protein